MDVIWTLLGAACGGAGAWLSMCRWGSGRTPGKKGILLILTAAGVGAVCGFLIPRRVDHWINWIRLAGSTALLAGAAWCDLEKRRIPNFFCLALLCVYAVSSALELAVFGTEALSVILGGLIGGAVAFGLLMLCRFFSRGGIGYGDVKILTALGTVMGLYGTISTIFLAEVAALLAALVLMLLRKASFKDSLPFAPFIYIGFALTLLLGTF